MVYNKIVVSLCRRRLVAMNSVKNICSCIKDDKRTVEVLCIADEIRFI